MRLPTLNKAQQKSLFALYCRACPDLSANPAKCLDGYRVFRRTGRHDTLCDCFMVPLWGMWIGIERDGYTHS